MKEPAWPLALEGQIRFGHVEIHMKEGEGLSYKRNIMNQDGKKGENI